MDMGGSMQISTLGGPGHVGTGGMPPVGGVGEVVMETMEVPDHCVGLGNGRYFAVVFVLIYFLTLNLFNFRISFFYSKSFGFS